jgi:serine-type D-Ala-D-Ala carboxypeptidase/endopeptidase
MRSLALAVAAGMLLGVANAALAQPAPTPVRQETRLQQLAPTIDELFRRYQQDSNVPGLVWGIVADGRLAYLNQSGVQDLQAKRPVNADTLFRIASMSKAFTALAILKLRDEGRLSLEAPVEAYVPELRTWKYPTSDSPKIRVRDLLSHTSGFVTDDPWGDRQQPISEAEFTRMLRDGVPWQRAPGTQFEYSNFGYALLGRIVTNVSGRPYKDYIEQQIMRPLGMASTGYEVREAPQQRRAIGYRWENERWSEEPTMPHGVFGAMGGVQTSANDYARWVAFLLAAWPARDDPNSGPVRRATVRELAQGLNFPSTRPIPGAPPEACPMAAAYGMGFIAASHCELGQMLFHGGGYPGYGSFLLLLPDHNVGIFAFANRTYAGPSPPVFATALELHRAGLLQGRTIAAGEALAAAYAAAGAMYRAGSVAPGRQRLAMNFLMDRSAENWTREFARLKAQTGDCRTDAPITATGQLAGRFSWTCDRGVLEGNLLLAPTHPPGIQALRLNPVPRP